MGLKKGPKRIAIGLGILAAVAFLGYRVTHSSKNVGESAKIDQVQLSNAAESAIQKTTDNELPLPSYNQPVGQGLQALWKVMAWNSQFPLMYGNGGVRTSQGSLIQQAGWDITVVRQDDCFKTIADFVENAKAIHDNPNTVPMIMSFMGDGVPGFSVMMKELDKLGPDYKPVVFYHMGRSNGEDAFMGPEEWKKNPFACLGKTVVGVERDGDVNIVLKWAADQGSAGKTIRVNQNTKVYDPEALNIIPAADFMEAAKKFTSGYTETRVLVRNGKTIPDSIITVGCDAVTTWTPGDVQVAVEKGGVVRLASTHEYSSQMPNASIILKKWADGHVTEMASLIAALGKAGDQVRSFPKAQEFAAKVSAEVYGDKDKPGSYWLKYARGVEEKDRTGRLVKLGGSQWFNLADAANTVGLGKDGIDRYKITYESFAKILEKLYPKEMKDWTPYDQIMEKKYLKAAMITDAGLLESATEQTEYASSDEASDVVSSKTYNIQFAVGQATINPASYKVIDEIFKSAVVSEGLTIFIYGHTDNTGSDEINQPLSERRAEAVKDYLMRKGMSSVRIKTKGYGSSQPITGTDGNQLDPSDIRNRCVEIKQGS